MRTLQLMCLLVLGTAPAVEHRAPEGYASAAGPQPAQPLPVGLVTTLEAPAGLIFLGQSWIVHYVVRNRGTQTFAIELGGDGRSSRPTRTWLEAVAPDGMLGEDPLRYRPIMSLGGLGGTFPVRPDGERVVAMTPHLFVEIDRPGRWVLRAFHDLGLGPMQGDNDPRWASVDVELAIPDQDQAAAVLAAHEALLAATDHGRSMGERSQTPANFAALSFPIYLPLLVQRAQAGWRRAIDGIAAIATFAASDALLDILEREPRPLPPIEAAYAREHQGLPLAHPHAAALKALALRLPPAAEHRLFQPEDPRLTATMDAPRIDRLRRLVMVHARGSNLEVRLAAAATLTRCVHADQRAELFACLDEAVSEPTDPPDRSPIAHLLVAWRSLPVQEPAPPLRPGAALVWLDRLQRDATWRPAGWQKALAQLLGHDAARVRELAIAAIPDGDAERWAPLLIPLLRDRDAKVARMATTCAGRVRHPCLLPALRTAMSDPQRNHSAANAIGAIAGRRAEVEAWIDEIERGQWQYSTSLAMQQVWWVLTERNLLGGWRGAEPDAAGRVALAARLRTFVAALPGLEQGKVAVDPAWDEGLLPGGWRIDLPDGATWPAGRAARPGR